MRAISSSLSAKHAYLILGIAAVTSAAFSARMVTAQTLAPRVPAYQVDPSWTPGVPTPMHFHDKDVVVVYLETGELASTSPDGQVQNNPHYFGFTKFNPRDRAHTETLVKGKGRAIIVELK